MTNQLKALFELLGQLPDEEQDSIAALILEHIEEMEWDTLLQSEHGQVVLAQLVAQAHEEIDHGEVEECEEEL